MVSVQAQNISNAIIDELESRDVRGLAIMAAAGAGGALLAQEVAERVLVMFDRPREPTSPSSLAISVLAKLGTAALIAFAGMQFGLTSGIGLVVIGVGAFGALVSAGVDAFDLLQRGGIPGAMPEMGGQQNQRQNQRRSAPRRQPSAGQTAEQPTASAATDGGSPYGDDPYSASA